MKTPEQKLEIAKKVWNDIESRGNDLEKYGEELGFSRRQMNNLYILKLCNAQDSFNQAIESML